MRDPMPYDTGGLRGIARVEHGDVDFSATLEPSGQRKSPQPGRSDMGEELVLICSDCVGATQVDQRVRRPANGAHRAKGGLKIPTPKSMGRHPRGESERC